MPFGGVGNSGLGSYTGIHSLIAFTRPQAVMVRSAKFDTHNLIRYPQYSGDKDSKLFRFAKWFVTIPVKGRFVLFVEKVLRKLCAKEILVIVASFLVGYYFRFWSQ